ncbi:MAG: DUF4388 domain-containing protein [Candidatus Zixiibacteriota bacterium]|nr:MAG: DUF4388 domain-containing protein [candidate division Zixibacteria bacterium]
MSTAVKTREAGLTGNLQTVPLSDLLQLVTTSAKTGMLSICRNEQKREIYFRKGAVIYASSSGNEDQLLGNLILSRKKISKADLERALSIQKLTGKKLGMVLLEMTKLTKEELSSFLRIQVEEIVYNLFGWNSGEFVFYDGKPPPAGQVTVDLNTMNVIMEGSRRIDEWIKIREILPPEETRLEIVTDPRTKSGSVELTVDDLRLFPLIDGDKTISELLQASTAGEFHTRKTLANFISLGLVRAGQSKRTVRPKVSVQKDLSRVIISLYSESYRTVERMASRKLGEGARKILKRCFDTQKSLHPILGKLESSQNFLDFSYLEASSDRITEPVRFHQLLDALNGLLAEFLKAIWTSLGSSLTRQVISQIKRETAQVVAQERCVAKEYGLEEELMKTLKRGQRCL